MKLDIEIVRYSKVQSPKVSVIIPTFNYAQYTKQAVESVLNQSFQNIELLIVDDGSTDETRTILRGIEDPRVTCIFQENRGVQVARNVGIRLAKGEYIAFLDADDYWMPYRLEKQISILDTFPSVALVYSLFYVVDAQGNVKGIKPEKIYSGRVLEQLLLNNFIGILTVLVRKSCFEKEGLIDEKLTVAGDWEMWLRLAAKYEFVGLNEPLASYRIHFTNAHLNRVLMYKQNIQILNKVSRQPGVGLSTIRKAKQGCANYYIALAGTVGCENFSLFVDYVKMAFNKSIRVLLTKNFAYNLSRVLLYYFRRIVKFVLTGGKYAT
jgi:glycosyltransferase involved in cell wall biosynthesis